MGIFQPKNQFLNLIKQDNKILFLPSVVTIVILTLFFSTIAVTKGQAQTLPDRPETWTTDWSTTGYASCDSDLNQEIQGSYSGTTRSILWTWTATEDGIGQIVGWDNDPVSPETTHRAYHYPEGVSNTNNVNNSDWNGAPQITPKLDDEHPYWSNRFLVSAGDKYQMRIGQNSIWAAFCFKEEARCDTEICLAEDNSGWDDCSRCDLNTYTPAECLQREVLCRQRAVTWRHAGPGQYPTAINDTTDQGRILWFNWAFDIDDVYPEWRQISCGTACGTGAICCPPTTPPTYDPWWQTSGGNIHSQGEINSKIPIECVASASCSEYLITKNADGDENSAGIPITEFGAIDTNNGYKSDRLDPEVGVINAKTHNNIKEDYAYFIKEVDIINDAQAVSGTILSLPFGATPVSDTEIYYSNNSLTIDLLSTQTVVAGTKKMIFVEGDLNFTSAISDINYIDVEEGGFLTFIVKGNINIDPDIGNSAATSTLTNLEGVFITDGTFNINGYLNDSIRDKKFISEGTIVAWSGFNLERDYTNTAQPLDYRLNSTNPIEVFIFRPDFHTNTSSLMLKPHIIWQEIN